MSTNEKPDGEKFLIGVGTVGALLLDFFRYVPPGRMNDGFWLCNAQTYPQRTIDRLIEGGYARIAEEKLMGRERLEITPAGEKEMLTFALKRSIELSAEIGAKNVTVDPGSPASMVTAQGLAFDLASFAIERARRAQGPLSSVMRPCLDVRVTVEDGNGGYRNETRDLVEFLKGEEGEPRWMRMARLLDLIVVLSESSVYGLAIGDMDEHAYWAGAMALEAFRIAPDQDWEMSEE